MKDNPAQWRRENIFDIDIKSKEKKLNSGKGKM
jgi:hypothetical protein